MASKPPLSLHDHRDDVVVPWISLNRSAAAATDLSVSSANLHCAKSHDDGGVIPVTNSYDHTNNLQPQHQLRANYRVRNQSCKLLSLLSARERVGVRSSVGTSVSRVGWLYEGRNVSPTTLAMSGAW